jgi:hypothetical protein
VFKQLWISRVVPSSMELVKNEVTGSWGKLCIVLITVMITCYWFVQIASNEFLTHMTQIGSQYITLIRRRRHGRRRCGWEDNIKTGKICVV